MMPKIQEILVEPSRIYTDSSFKIRIKIEDYYLKKRRLISEDGKQLITEENKKIRTEWGDKNE